MCAPGIPRTARQKAMRPNRRGLLGALGAIPARAFVAMNSGWDSRVDDPAACVDADGDGTRTPPDSPRRRRGTWWPASGWTP